MTENVLSVRNITKVFAGVKALDNVSLDIAPGEIHCLAGENGCGKSTLIKVISGVYQPEGGEITIGDKTFSSLTPIEAINHGIQVIYQDFSVFPNLTVMENLALNTELAQHRKFVSWKRYRELAEKAVATIGFQVDLDAKVGDLPVADKQLVAICRALMNDTKLIIMDEPTTALTSKEVEALFKVILDLQSRGISILFVSHKLDEVFHIAERFTILRNGRLVTTKPTAELDRRSFARYMTGREVDEERFPQPETVGEPVLEVKNLSLKDAYSDVSFTLHRGEVLGITGLLGSGRTELALTLFGVFPADSGEIKVAGQTAELNTIADALKHKIAYVPEDRLTEGLMLERSIADNIIVSQLDSLTTSGFLDPAKREAAVTQGVESLNIATANPDNPVNTLSGGNQQRVVLAKWLATEPDVLILNGPTVGVDIGSKHDIHVILQDLAKQGKGIIIISDDVPELMQSCRRIAILTEGRLTAEVDPEQMSEADVTRLVAAGPMSQGVN